MNFRYEFPPGNGKSYTQIPFTVPPGTEYIVIRACHWSGQGLIDMGLVDAQQQIRGWSHNLNQRGHVLLGEEQATCGYLAGPLLAGAWNILLGDSRPHKKPIVVELELELCPWRSRLLRGDIHGHSFYSDGLHGIETKLYMARQSRLDFLAFSDHNSVAQNFCLPTDPAVLLLPSCEITTYNGHVNIFGCQERRIPNFMCQSSDDMRRVLTELKEQGLWLQLNHPIRSGDVAGCQWGWDYDMPFDWIEIWNGPWDQNCVANVKIWQGFLEQGRFLPAVANSDFHSAARKWQGYPCNNVWAGRKNSSEIYRALAKGHNYATAEPLAHRSFAAQCFLKDSGEFVPFGSAVQGPLVLELSTAQAYLAETSPLIFRVWNESGLYREETLPASAFAECTEESGHDRKFCLQLDGGNRFQRFELFSGEEALLLSNPIFGD